MTSLVVLTEMRGRALWLTINRPDKRNALNNEVIAGLNAGLDQASADPDCRAVVLTGTGDKAFCAGGDLGDADGFKFDVANPRTPFGDLLRQATTCPLPIIGAVNGACVAGGLGLLALADLAVAVERAKFGLPEVKVGLFPMQVVALLKDIVAPRHLRYWAMTGEMFGSHAALEAGLVSSVVADDQLMAASEALVEQLAANSPIALKRGKYALNAMAKMATDEAISFAESQLTLLALSGDAKEGLAAFKEKRPPKFNGN